MTITLVDANYIMHSTYYVSKSSRNKTEEFVKDQIRRIKSILSYHKNCCFIYDSKNGSQTNKNILDGYKSSRSSNDDQAKEIFKATRALVRALGYSYASHPKYEADQVIGSYALHLFEKGIDVKILAVDKDFNQLVKRKGIIIYDPLKNCLRTYDDILTRYKIKPEQFAMFLTLVGDAIDDVPGLTGCGPATAVKFIEQYKKYSIARKEIFNVEKPNKVELNFQNSIELIDKCFKVVKLTKINGLAKPPEPEVYSEANLKSVCDKFNLNYHYLFK